MREQKMSLRLTEWGICVLEERHLPHCLNPRHIPERSAIRKFLLSTSEWPLSQKPLRIDPHKATCRYKSGRVPDGPTIRSECRISSCNVFGSSSSCTFLT